MQATHTLWAAGVHSPRYCPVAHAAVRHASQPPEAAGAEPEKQTSQDRLPVPVVPDPVAHGEQDAFSVDARKECCAQGAQVSLMEKCPALHPQLQRSTPGAPAEV